MKTKILAGFEICISVPLNSILNSTKIPLILLMSAIFWKQSAFFGKNGTFTEIYSMRDVLVLLPVFVR